ncbi:CoA transferase [Blastococcus sp. URHD0036]|uniref:CaiB/BaiF CoA-transferase family protein n=1 Tax=Blastococcus sp. URHD0036 TaxID=1380356 RepID=UPI0004973A8D|nr:CoA transferase [Blastococcus sp. URHD0036]
MRQALSDISVVQLGTGVAAEWCGKVFADLGADVLKVEPPSGDPLRAEPGAFATLVTNKRSMVLERSSDVREELLALVDAADLVVETPGSGALADWGVDRAELMDRRPGLSVVALTGFGATGPYAGHAWSDLVAQAFAGTLLLDRRGPVRLPMSVTQCAFGHTAAAGALAAVLRARASGVGAFVDCAASEALAANPTRMGRYLGWEYGDRKPLAEMIADSSSTVLPVGPHPCADGFVAMMMIPPQLREMLTVLDSDELHDFFARPDAFVRPEAKEVLDGALYPWLLTRTRREVTDAAQAAGWPVTPVNVPAEVLAADHLYQRGFWVHAVDPELGPVVLPGAPYRFAEGGWQLRRAAPRLGQSEPPGPAAGEESRPVPPVATAAVHEPPLRGLRVLDLTTVWSGPLLTMHLADLGAEVIRVESPRVFPPTTRGYSPKPTEQMLLSSILGGYGPARPDRPDRPYNRHSLYNSINRGKRSCTLDLRDAEQRELFLRLVAQSDVFVENLKSSTLHQLGIHETELLAANPRMIVLRIPPAGLTGDWAHYTGFGGQFDGLTGFASLCGHRGTELYETPTSQHMDSVTGPAGVFALLAALHYRAATGRGQVVELAQSENVLAQLGDVFVDLQRGRQPQRYGNRDPLRAPQGLYVCADGRPLAVTATDDEAWQALAAAIGRPDLAADESLARAEGRHVAHDRLDEAIGAWAGTVTAYEGFAALQAVGVAAAPHLSEGEFAADPQVVAREWIRPLDSTDVGRFDHLGHAFRGIPLAWDRGAPVLGEDNEYVFRELLGLDADEYRRLVERGVASEDYLDPSGRPV